VLREDLVVVAQDEDHEDNVVCFYCIRMAHEAIRVHELLHPAPVAEF
jgi:hypothetical protein